MSQIAEACVTLIGALAEEISKNMERIADILVPVLQSQTTNNWRARAGHKKKRHVNIMRAKKLDARKRQQEEERT